MTLLKRSLMFDNKLVVNLRLKRGTKQWRGVYLLM